MATVEELLRDLVKETEPTDTQHKKADASPKFLREELEESRFGARIIASYLSGSYARRTAVYPLDDVDIVFLVEPDRWRRGFFETLPSPEKVLSSFEGAIRRRPSYQQSSVYKQRRSVRLELSVINLDVVPAVETDKEDVIRIPCRQKDGWIVSAPAKHTKIIKKIHDSCNFRLKPLVRILKTWNNGLPETTRLKSFAVETLAATLFSQEGISSYEDGVLAFFDFVAHLGGLETGLEWNDSLGISFGGTFTEPRLYDLAGTGSNLFANTKPERLKKFATQASRSIDYLIKADKARFEDTREEYVLRALT